MSNANAIRVVVFDLDGVVRFWDPAIIRDAEAEARIPAGSLQRAVLEDQALLRLATTGVITDEEWRSEIGIRLKDAYGLSALTAVDAWSASAGTVVNEVLDLVRWTRARTQVALLSNATTRLSIDLESLALVEEFDAVYNTAVLGVTKPNAAIFHEVCNDLEISLRATAFVDDSITHVRAAHDLGISAHHFTMVESLRDFLNQLRYA